MFALGTIVSPCSFFFLQPCFYSRLLSVFGSFLEHQYVSVLLPPGTAVVVVVVVVVAVP